MASRHSLPLLLAAPFLVAACGGSSHSGTPCDTSTLSACSQSTQTRTAVDDVLFLLVHGELLHQFQYSEAFFAKLDETFQCDQGSVALTREDDETLIAFNTCSMDESGEDEHITLSGAVQYRAPTSDQAGALHYRQIEMSGGEFSWWLNGDETLAPLASNGSRRTALSLNYRLTQNGVSHDYRADTAYDFHGLDTPNNEQGDWADNFDVQRYGAAGQIIKTFRYDLIDTYSTLRLDNVGTVEVTDGNGRTWTYLFSPPDAVRLCQQGGTPALLGQFTVTDNTGNQLAVSASQCGLYESTLTLANMPH